MTQAFAANKRPKSPLLLRATYSSSESIRILFSTLPIPEENIMTDATMANTKP